MAEDKYLGQELKGSSLNPVCGMVLKRLSMKNLYTFKLEYLEIIGIDTFTLH